MTVRGLIFACLAAWPVAAQTGVEVNVRVVNSATGAPIPGADVVLNHERDEQVSGKTDTGGKFAGRVKSEGHYLLTVMRKGYRMPGIGMGKVVEIGAGAEANVEVKMLPLGVIAGRVLDQYGDPVRNAIVRTENKMSAPGGSEYYEGYSAGTTDDRGEYRIAEVGAGKYYVVAEYNTDDLISRSGINSRYHWPRTGGLVLYPDAPDMEQAQLVDVAAGATIRLNDMHVKIQRAVTISGKIKPPPTQSGQSLNLRRASGLALSTSPMVQGGSAEEDGSFKIEALPGKYFLTASDMKTSKISKPIPLELGDKDISGLELALTSGYDLNGRIVVDGSETIDFSKLRLNFGGPPVKIEANGTFQTQLLFDGQGSYFLQDFPEGWYVKNVHIAGKRIEGRQFHIDPGTADMTITLNPHGGQVSITVEGTGNGFAVVYVALLPEGGAVPDVESILQGRPADASGRFIVGAVPPGSYRVFTLDASNWVLLMQPGLLMEKYRTSASLISVADGEQKNVVVPATKIPVE